jgi:hypothetical protein
VTGVFEVIDEKIRLRWPAWWPRAGVLFPSCRLQYLFQCSTRALLCALSVRTELQMPPATLGPHSAPLPPLLTADGTPSAPPFCTISNLNTAPCALSGATRIRGSYALDCLHLGLLCALASSYFACSFASGRLPGVHLLDQNNS